MATATGDDTLAVADWDHASESKSDRYLSARLAAAAADFKGVAAATFALAAAVAALVWLAAGVVAEHWLVPGGLPVWARWAWFATGALALAAAVVRWVVPLVRYRVNLVYAARVIEQEHPELHNDLVNTVLVKAHPEAASPTVARSLERRAAKRLSTVPADGVADRAMPLWLACGLAAVVAAVVTYELVAPKSFVVSAARLVAPWWGLAAPARVSIAPPRLSWRMPPDGTGGDRPGHPLEAVAGTVSLVRGRQLVVETDIAGLHRDERAVLEVTPLRDDGSADAAASPWRLPLAAAATGRMTVVVPDAARGLQQAVEIVVTAGDARSDRVRVAVVDTPTLLVREVRYDYPPYTGRKPETVAWQGDLRAPEFTKVTITAEGNRPLEAAWIDPGCGGRDSEKKRMRIGQHDLARAVGEFPLRLNADHTGPEFASYRLAFQPRASAGGREPPVVEKLEHRIEVVADVAPDVAIEAPEDAIRVPPSAPVSIRVRAIDPDYGLARVGIETRLRGAAESPPAWLLERPHVGPFVAVAELVPERLGAAAGSVVEYRAVAVDTRPEKPNVTHSPWRSLRIDAAAPPPPRQAPPAVGADGAGDTKRGGERGGDPRGDAGGRGERGDGGGESGQENAGEQGAGEQNAGDGARDSADARQGDRGADDRRESGERGAKQPERRDAGASADGNESPEQGAQAGGGEPNAGAAGVGGQGQAQPERSGAGTSGMPGAAGNGPGQGANAAAGRSGSDREEAGRSEVRGQDAPAREAVDADGNDDGAAMERIVENFRRGGDRTGQEEDEPRGQAAQTLEREGTIRQRQASEGSAENVRTKQTGERDGQVSQRRQQSGDIDQDQAQRGDVKNVELEQGQRQRGQIAQNLEQEGTIRQGQAQKGTVENVRMHQAQGQDGQVSQNERQADEATQREMQQGSAKNVEIGQSQQQKSQVDQDQGQQGRHEQSQAAEVAAENVRMAQGQKQNGQVKQDQQQRGDSVEERLGRHEAENVDQTRNEQQTGQIDERSHRDERGMRRDREEVRQDIANEVQQPSAEPACRNADGKPCGRPECSSCSGAGQRSGSDTASSSQSSQAQDAAHQAAQGQAQQRQGAVSQSQQRQNQQSQGLLSQGQQEQNQQSQNLVGQSQDSQAQQHQSLVGHDGKSDREGQGGPSGGQRQGEADDAMPGEAPSARPLEWGEQDVSHARNTVDLAIKHLRDSVNAGRTDVLDELGWTPEQARAFIDRWEAMRRLAGSANPRERGDFERALRSLGLRPGGVRNTRDVPADAKGGQAEGRRSRPPAAYREQVEAYLRGTGGG